MQLAMFGELSSAKQRRPQAETRFMTEIGRLLERNINWYCMGTNKDGSPKHPLARGHNRIPDDQQPILWRTV
jgi:hypothetical protein